MSDVQVKSVYLKKEDEIVGLFAAGYAEPHEQKVQKLDGSITIYQRDFVEEEKWGNEYNEKGEMLGPGSFRIHGLCLEDIVKDFEEDGWVKFTPDWVKE